MSGGRLLAEQTHSSQAPARKDLCPGTRGFPKVQLYNPRWLKVDGGGAFLEASVAARAWRCGYEGVGLWANNMTGAAPGCPKGCRACRTLTGLLIPD